MKVAALLLMLALLPARAFAESVPDSTRAIPRFCSVCGVATLYEIVPTGRYNPHTGSKLHRWQYVCPKAHEVWVSRGLWWVRKSVREVVWIGRRKP